MFEKTYVLITPAHNEEDYIEKTIQSVISQTISPLKWIIVSDGSTDRTDEIVSRYEGKYRFIELVRRDANGSRDFSSKVFAIQAGLKCLQGLKFDYLGILDADVSFDSDYFQRLLEEFEDNHKLGIGGGTIYELGKGKYRARSGNRVRSVPGALQLFRRECIEQIGGFTPLKHGGEDVVMEIRAKMLAWEVRSFFDLVVFHHRPTGTEGRAVFSVPFQEGRRDYLLGSHPIYVLLKGVRRLADKPWLVGSLLRLTGYCSSILRREKRQIPNEVVQFLRREQIDRLSRLFKKK
jgi:glycosyltransferase involved in cell wall biosynthesis